MEVANLVDAGHPSSRLTTSSSFKNQQSGISYRQSLRQVLNPWLPIASSHPLIPFNTASLLLPHADLVADFDRCGDEADDD
jgi:hypothetical protein